MTQATIGRTVYYQGSERGANESESPVTCMAFVVAVLNEQNLVNLKVLYPDGNEEFVKAVKQSETHEFRTWDWMPYQKGQAAKTEQLEAVVHNLSDPLPLEVKTDPSQPVKCAVCGDEMHVNDVEQHYVEQHTEVTNTDETESPA